MAVSDPALLLLLDEVRGHLLRVLHDVVESEARWAPPGLQNSILWHAGHCYVVVESLTCEALGQPTHYPHNWFDMFSWKSQPAQIDPRHWPSLATVRVYLQQQHVRLRHELAELALQQLDQPLPPPSKRTVRAQILHALLDEAHHSGEIWLLRKMLRCRS